MRRLPILLFALLAGCMPSAEAANDSFVNTSLCASNAAIPVNIKTIFNGPRFDTTENMAWLQTLKHSKTSIHEELALGLTDTQPALHSSVALTRTQYPSGAACITINHVDVTIGYQDVIVFIPTEIPQGTCGYDEIRKHELKHVATDLALLKEYLPQFGDRLHAYLQQYGANNRGNANVSAKYIENNLNTILTNTFDQMTADLSKRQSQVDNPDEYKRVNASCNGELQTVARDFRQSGR